MKRLDEQALYNLYLELNGRYFNQALYVQRVRYGKFLSDVFRGGITFGQFSMEIDKATRSVIRSEIFVNPYLLMTSVVSLYPWLPEVVVYHEMCHAHLMMNLRPARLHGIDRCGVHGEDFYALMYLHPLAKQAEELVEGEVGMAILREAEHDARVYLETHPTAQWKTKPREQPPSGWRTTRNSTITAALRSMENWRPSRAAPSTFSGLRKFDGKYKSA